MRWVLVLVVLLAASWPREQARACDFDSGPLSSGLSLPVDTTVGTRPLLTSAYVDGVLSTMTGEVIPISSAGPFGVLGSIKVWMPAEPLPAGQYLWDSGYGPRALFVDPERAPEPVPTLSEGDFDVILEDSTSGCGGDSCGSYDPSHVAIRYASTQDELILAIWVGGQYAVWGPVRGTSTITLAGHHFSGGLRTAPICARLTAFSLDGVQGNTLELGCSDPDSGEHIDDRQGCASTHATDAYALLLAGLVLALRRPRRPV